MRVFKYDLEKAYKEYKSGKDIDLIMEDVNKQRREKTVGECKELKKDSLMRMFRKYYKEDTIKPIEKVLTKEELIEIEKQKALVNHEKKKVNESLKLLAQEDIICDKIMEAVKVVRPYPITKVKLYGANKNTDKIIPVVIMSDIQAGTYISKEATGGLNAYDKTVLPKQFKTFLNGIVSIANTQLKETPILKLNMLGDMVEGMGIFPGQAYHVDQDLYDQFFTLIELIAKLLQELLQVFDKIEINCVPGNHGRVGKKGENPNYINWDLFMYKHLEQKLQNFTQIKWNITKAWFILDKTFNYTSLLIHGDGIKAWNGIPFYGIQRADSRYTKMLATKQSYYDFIQMGHIHTAAEIPTPTGPIMVNGSWIGGSMFSLKDMNTTGRPEQRMFGIHKDHGMIWRSPIYLDF